jgi:hypothetical protein
MDPAGNASDMMAGGAVANSVTFTWTARTHAGNNPVGGGKTSSMLKRRVKKGSFHRISTAIP